MPSFTMGIKNLADCADFLGAVVGCIQFRPGVISVSAGQRKVELSTENWRDRAATDIVVLYLVPACISLQQELYAGTDSCKPELGKSGIPLLSEKTLQQELSAKTPPPDGQILPDPNDDPTLCQAQKSSAGLDARTRANIISETDPYLARPGPIPEGSEEIPPTRDPSQAEGSPTQPTS